MTGTRGSRVALGAGVVLLVAVSGTVALRPVFAQPALTVAATLPWWDPRGVPSMHAAVEDGLVTELSPVWATPTAGGGLDVVPVSPGAELLGRTGVRLLPSVQNYVDRRWQGELVAGIVTDPSATDHHRRLLVEAVLAHDWTGIDIDYGDLPPTAGSALVRFFTALRDDLHRHDKELSITVPARVDDEERSEALGYSYQLLGSIADQLRIRTHYHAWDASEPGPVAPLAWVEDVVRYAVERVPREKLVLGLATNGYDWGGEGPGTELQTADALTLAAGVGAVPRWDPEGAASTFGYARDGVQHTVWFEDARSAELKSAVARREGLRGVTVWRLGGEDARLWDALETATEGTT